MLPITTAFPRRVVLNHVKTWKNLIAVEKYAPTQFREFTCLARVSARSGLKKISQKATFGSFSVKKFPNSVSAKGSLDPSAEFDFPQLLDVLPENIKAGKVLNFPLLNPWRLGIPTTGLDNTEEEFQRKRADILDSKFPASGFPSVSKILQGSQTEMAKENLNRWKLKMTEELGEVGFIEHQRKLFHRGSLLHRSLALLLENQTEPKISPVIKNLWESLRPVLPNISNVRVIERHISHPFLCYKGVVDCVAVYERQLCLIDWKTSSKQKPTLSNLFDEPLQAAAYLGALNYDRSIDYQVVQVALIIAYEDGQPAQVHRLSHSHCRDYWKIWLGRLKTYWETLDAQ